MTDDRREHPGGEAPAGAESNNRNVGGCRTRRQQLHRSFDLIVAKRLVNHDEIGQLTRRFHDCFESRASERDGESARFELSAAAQSGRGIRIRDQDRR